MDDTRNISVEEWTTWQATAFRQRRRFFRFIFRQVLARLLWRVSVEGLDNVPADGPGALMMSHSTIPDITVPLAVIKNRDIVPMSKEENFAHPIISKIVGGWGAFPIKRGEVDRHALQITIKLLQQGEMILMMPEGTRTPALQQAKDGLTYILLKADVPVIPAAVWGLEKFVQDALIPWRRSDVHIRIGRPFRLNSGGRRRVPRDEMAQMTREMMFQLARLYPPHKRGDYADLALASTEYLSFI